MSNFESWEAILEPLNDEHLYVTANRAMVITLIDSFLYNYLLFIFFVL